MVSRVTLLNLWLGSFWGWGELWRRFGPGSLTSIVDINDSQECSRSPTGGVWHLYSVGE